MKKIDLHVHTNYSDGQLNIFDIFELAKRDGVKSLAITDHDTIINLTNVEDIARLFDIEFFKGIEISVGYPYNMHILGYGIIDAEKVEEYIRTVKHKNIQICEDVINLLQQEGYEISLEEVYADIERRKIQNYINYRVVAQKCREHNIPVSSYMKIREEMLDKRAIAKLLVKKGYARGNKEVYDGIMGRGCKCYIPINKISARNAINLIISSGGVAVLAHPNTIEVENQEQLKELIVYLTSLGLRGIETINMSKFDQSATEYLNHIAEKNRLIVTAGTDFHSTSINGHDLGVEVKSGIIDLLKTEIKKANERFEKLGVKSWENR